MKTITVTFGDKTYSAALLSFADYKSAAGYFLEIQRAGLAMDLAASVAGTERLLEILHAAIAQVDSTVTLEQIANQAGPGDVMGQAAHLMTASNSVMRTIGAKAN